MVKGMSRADRLTLGVTFLYDQMPARARGDLGQMGYVRAVVVSAQERLVRDQIVCSSNSAISITSSSSLPTARFDASSMIVQ